MTQETSSPWYKKGIKFKCTSCGKCCSGSPGYVFLTKKEAANIAEFLGLPLKDFFKRFLRHTSKQLSLIEVEKSPQQYDCVFLKDNKCTIYPCRPKQCQTFPWWPQNIHTPQALEELSKECEGFRQEDAPLVSFKEIQDELKRHENN